MTSRGMDFALAAAASLLFGCLTIVMLSGGMAGFDGAIRTEVHGFSAPWLTTCAEIVTRLGSLNVLALFGGIELVALMRAGRRGDAKFVVFVMTGAVILENVVKFSVHRPRPPPFFGTDPVSFSFPSGHAFFSLCFYGSLAVILSRSGASRAVTWAVAVCLVCAIGTTRIYLGVHYPSDVVGGYLLAIAWLSAARVATAGRAPPALPVAGTAA